MYRLLLLFALFFSITIPTVVTSCGANNEEISPLIFVSAAQPPQELADAVPDTNGISRERFWIVDPPESGGGKVSLPDDIQGGFTLIMAPGQELERLRFAVDDVLAKEESVQFLWNPNVTPSIVNVFYPLLELSPGDHRVTFWLKFSGNPHFHFRSARFTR